MDNGIVLAQLERILASDPFRDSPTQQRLLRHLIEETLAGRARELKEYNIGVQVFHRGDDFEPRTDSIVRVQVGVLRKKLSAYYELPAHSAELRLEIPRGQYAASFHPPAPQTIENRTSRWPRDLALAAAGLLLGLLLWLPFRHAPSTPREFAFRNHPLWDGFFDDDSSTQLVMGAPMFLQMNGVYVRDSMVNTPEDLENDHRLHDMAVRLKAELRPEEIYTGLGEAAGLYTLGRFFSQGGRDLPLVRSRLARWQDLAHSNLLILSSFRFRTFSQELNLPHEFEFDAEKTLIRNLHPRSGEAATYSPVFRRDNGDHDYALVSAWPSPQAGRHIMVLSGIYTWGTQGVAEYVVDGPSLRALAPRLLADRPSRHSGLQIVIKVLVHDRQPSAYSYVTHRWLQN